MRPFFFWLPWLRPLPFAYPPTPKRPALAPATPSRATAGPATRSVAYGIFPAAFTVENGQVKTLEIRMNDGLEQDPYVFSKQ